ncbi:hypothetical protein SAMN05421858_0631 [Haladaptatus litoreus]|uniref:Uncharacterized protein n=1 Tax=Haladaptatus litoreus TaxID=553468 RepID=A0A1N6W7Y5_9EURY|nr:hypothetical protein [Haladaptatus litoreus]SIQ86241.1 hypothetical protein SAMN05421858_0631 [Haladaptatus litoreus]
MTDKSNTDGLNRRTLMKKAATTAVVGAGVAAASGSASAKPTLEEQYADPIRTESLFAEHAGDLMAMLSKDGLLQSADVYSEVHTRKTVGFSDIAKKNEGTTFLKGVSGRADEIVSVRNVEDGVVSITVEPETGRAYAFHEPESSDKTFLYNPDIGTQAIDTQACNTDCFCSPVICENTRSAECETCCDGDCQTNYFCNC